MANNWMSKLMVGGCVAAGLFVPGAAGAQTDYVGNPPPTVPPAAVQGLEIARTVPPPAQVAAVETSSGGLPVTGGDVTGLAVIGLGAVGAGTVLVRRSRTRKA